MKNFVLSGHEITNVSQILIRVEYLDKAMLETILQITIAKLEIVTVSATSCQYW